MPSEKLDPLLSATIFARDGGRCVFCDHAAEDGAVLTVDHILPRSWGGSDLASNLVTCCRPCNDQKGTADAEAFADMVGRYKDSLPKLARFGTRTPADIKASVRAAGARPANFAEGGLYLARLRFNRRGG